VAYFFGHPVGYIGPILCNVGMRLFLGVWTVALVTVYCRPTCECDISRSWLRSS